jgi:16S rRNA G527 N7-methylase RsmG
VVDDARFIWARAKRSYKHLLEIPINILKNQGSLTMMKTKIIQEGINIKA